MPSERLDRSPVFSRSDYGNAGDYSFLCMCANEIGRTWAHPRGWFLHVRELALAQIERERPWPPDQDGYDDARTAHEERLRRFRTMDGAFIRRCSQAQYQLALTAYARIAGVRPDPPEDWDPVPAVPAYKPLRGPTAATLTSRRLAKFVATYVKRMGRNPVGKDLQRLERAAALEGEERAAATRRGAPHKLAVGVQPVLDWTQGPSLRSDGGGGIHKVQVDASVVREPVRFPRRPPGPTPAPRQRKESAAEVRLKSRESVERKLLELLEQAEDATRHERTQPLGLGFDRLRKLLAPKGAEKLSAGLTRKAIESLRNEGVIRADGNYRRERYFLT
jgi:hypothetical protein